MNEPFKLHIFGGTIISVGMYAYGLLVEFLLHINPCRLFNAKSIFILLHTSVWLQEK